MALNLGSIFAMLGADTSGLNRGEARMRQFVHNVNRGYASVEASANKLKGVIGTVIGFEAIRRATMLADEYKGLNARIQNATKATKDYHAVQKRLQSMSMNTGTSFAGNVDLFSNLARSAPEVGASQKEVLRLTESLNKLGVISGASGEAMKNSMMQFGQAMAGGILRAEEFNSIVENTPEIANRIAKGMGLTIGGLRMAVLEGKVLSKDVFGALLKQSEEIDADFQQMPRRIGQSMESLKTGGMSFLGQLDSSLGVTDMLASKIQGIAEWLNGDFSQGFFQIKQYVSSIGDSFGLWGIWLGDAKGGIQDFDGTLGFIANKVRGLVSWLGDAFVKMPANLRFTMEQFGLFVADEFTKIETQIRLIGPAFDLVWEVVKLGAATAAGFVAGQFAAVISNILGGIQNMAGFAAGVADTIGWEGASNSINALSKGLDTGTQKANELTEALKKSAAESVTKIGQITKGMGDIVEQQNMQLEFHAEEKAASQANYEAQLQMLEDRKAQREVDWKDQQAKAEAEKKLAEDTYNTQAKLAAKAAAAKSGGGGKGGKGGQSEAEKFAKEAQAKLDALERSLQTELETEMEHYNQSLEALRTAEQLKLDSVLPYHEMRERLEKEHQKRMREIAAEGSGSITKMQAWSNLLGLDYQQKVDDMSFREKGEHFSQMIDQAAGYSKEFFEIKKALAMATALIEAPKAVLSAFTFGNELGGPIVGAIFGAVAGAAAAVQIAAISSQQFTASKATGGNVFGNQTYRVNEQGPEMLSVGGEDFLMMGSQGGSITPNHMLGGGGGGSQKVNVTVNNYGNDQVTVRERQGLDGKEIEVLIKRIDESMAGNIKAGRGKTHKAIQDTYGVGRKGAAA